MKIRPVGAELFHTDRHDEANSHFSQFCERPSKTSISVIRYGIQWNNVFFLLWSEGLKKKLMAYVRFCTKFAMA